MDMSLMQILGAIVMVGVATALVFGYQKYLAVGSEWRMLRMLKRVGVDPAIASSGDHKAIMKGIRQRCQKCASEDVCERWLTGDEHGGYAFCPNSNVFDALRKQSGAVV